MYSLSIIFHVVTLGLMSLFIKISKLKLGCTDLNVQAICQVHLLRCTRHQVDMMGAFIKMYMTLGQQHRCIHQGEPHRRLNSYQMNIIVVDIKCALVN